MIEFFSLGLVCPRLSLINFTGRQHSYAEPCISYGRGNYLSVCLFLSLSQTSVRPSVTRWH